MSPDNAYVDRSKAASMWRNGSHSLKARVREDALTGSYRQSSYPLHITLTSARIKDRHEHCDNADGNDHLLSEHPQRFQKRVHEEKLKSRLKISKERKVKRRFK